MEFRPQCAHCWKKQAGLNVSSGKQAARHIPLSSVASAWGTRLHAHGPHPGRLSRRARCAAASRRICAPMLCDSGPATPMPNHKQTGHGKSNSTSHERACVQKHRETAPRADEIQLKSGPECDFHGPAIRRGAEHTLVLGYGRPAVRRVGQRSGAGRHDAAILHVHEADVGAKSLRLLRGAVPRDAAGSSLRDARAPGRRRRLSRTRAISRAGACFGQNAVL